jgi:branched-chain amino acid aminotransferase
MTYCNWNGKVVQEGTPIIAANNRGLRYGDGLFETIKLSNGRLVMSDEHFARLWNGMQRLQFDIPKHFSPDVLEEQVYALAKKNGHINGARVRLNIVRGDGGLYDAKNHSPNYIIQTWALPEGNGTWNSNGLIAGIFTGATKSCDAISNLKHNNYLPYVLAALCAKKEKWNDAILLNSQHSICDSTIANIFMVKDEIIFTPALSQGCVAGVMRHGLIQFLKKSGWQIVEKAITVDELLLADEVFFTNSMYNIRWVKQINESTYSNNITQKIYSNFVPTIY